MKILVTGAAGFIGMHVSSSLLKRGHQVIGIDNLNDYYDPALKQARVEQVSKQPGFVFRQMDIADMSSLSDLFKEFGIQRVVHLAAQPGVRYSITNPHAYVSSNLVGFVNILEACRHNEIEHLVYASSSSVYGGNEKLPFSEGDLVDHPISLYAATKKSNELMAHSYSHLFQLPTTGLRFFTVYGPWGRPDMSPVLFARAIFEGRPIEVFNYGKMQRDFTYVDDIVEGVLRVLDKPPQADAKFDAMNPNPATSKAPWRIYNIGNHQPVQLMDYINTISSAVGKPAQIEFKPLQPGDLLATFADTDKLEEFVGYVPNTPLEVGIGRMVEWVREFYKY